MKEIRSRIRTGRKITEKSRSARINIPASTLVTVSKLPRRVFLSLFPITPSYTAKMPQTIRKFRISHRKITHFVMENYSLLNGKIIIFYWKLCRFRIENYTKN